MKKKLFENVGGNSFKMISESSLSETPQKLVNRDPKAVANLIFALKIGTGIQFHQGEKSYNKFISIEKHPTGDEYIYVTFDNHHEKGRYETDDEVDSLAQVIAAYPDYDYYEYYEARDNDGKPIKARQSSYPDDPDDQDDTDYPPDKLTWADISRYEK